MKRGTKNLEDRAARAGHYMGSSGHQPAHKLMAGQRPWPLHCFSLELLHQAEVFCLVAAGSWSCEHEGLHEGKYVSD